VVFYVLDRNAAERLAGSRVVVKEPDARAWAEAFVKHKESLGWKAEQIDEGLMLGWFANFIAGGDPPTEASKFITDRQEVPPIPEEGADYERTSSGLILYAQFEDRYNNKITVQESSLAEEPCVWVFARGDQVEDPSPHLTVDQARKLIGGLQKFIEHTERMEGKQSTLDTLVQCSRCGVIFDNRKEGGWTWSSPDSSIVCEKCLGEINAANLARETEF
jgi:hypothetical protein